MVGKKKRHSLFVGGCLILCNPVSVKLESPDSGNGHKKMYWFLLVDHASPLAFPRDTTFLQQKQKTLPQPSATHCPPQPWGIHFIKHSAWTPWMVASKRFGCSGRNIYVSNWKSKKDIIYRKRQQTVEFLSNSKFGGTNLKPKKPVSQRWKIWRWWPLPWNPGLGAPKTPLNLICFKASGWSKSILGRLIYKRRHEYL